MTPGEEEAPPERRLRLGVLHVGRPESGVRRYGRILAEAAAARTDVELIEADAGLLEGSRGGLGAPGRELAGAEVVQMQWNRRGWGGGPRSAWRYRQFRRACRRPLVVTLHDVFDRDGVRERWLAPEAWSLRWLGRTAARIVVHSRVEVARLAGLVPEASVRVIPHFVEERRLPLSRAEAKAALGVEGQRIVTLLGFVYGRKGHKVAVETLPRLPRGTLLVFAGGPVAGRDMTYRTVLARAGELGMDERLRVTGYLSEADLETWMAATDLAILPFRDLSASGSLSSWIASGKPMLVSDLPGFREYDQLEAGALRIFGPSAPDVLADAIGAALATDLPEVDPRVVALREHLSVAKTVERYLAVDREAAATA